MADIILASQSPRRKQLLELAEIDFDIQVADIDETPPEGMPGEDVPEHLARQKAAVISAKNKNAIVIAADTIVLLDHEILSKPMNEEDAIAILTKLSGKVHQVISGVCIMRGDTVESFSETTAVHFRPLTEEQIRHYVTNYKPYDKAGAYAIQEWIGMVGIEKINGDYYNVMGLPVGLVVQRLKKMKKMDA
ncbi:MAG: septum formation protein Maf [Chitinophagales bacterium]|nr:septum formation protein Maf [Chitinophagales bacterium]